MPRRHSLRGVKFCAHCGAGYDGFKARDSRGRYCSPSCLAAARAQHRGIRPEALAAADVLALHAP